MLADSLLQQQQQQQWQQQQQQQQVIFVQLTLQLPMLALSLLGTRT
jgi:hypothetical protein